jgi:hypothetical protein
MVIRGIKVSPFGGGLRGRTLNEVNRIIQKFYITSS